MKIKTVLILFAIIILFISGCGVEENTPSNEQISSWKTYENKELGISFQHPVDFKVSKMPYSIKIETDYGILRELQSSQGISSININTNINIVKKSDQKADVEDIEDTLLNTLNQFLDTKSKYKITSVEKVHNYDLLKFERGNLYGYYILSDKGTFIVSDDLNEDSLKTLKEEGLYGEYRTKFDNIISSIKII